MLWLSQHHSSFRIVVGFREAPSLNDKGLLDPYNFRRNDKGLLNKVCMISECNLSFPERHVNNYEKPIAIDLDQTWHLFQNRYSVHKHQYLTGMLNGAYWKAF